MIEAGGGNIRAVLSFGEDEGALDDGLGVERETLGTPLPIDIVLAHRFGDFRFNHCSVLADALIAGFSDGRMRLIDFLNHSAEQANEFGQIALRKST